MSQPQIGTMILKGLVCNRRCLKCEGSTFNKERALVRILSEYWEKENSCEISLRALLATRHHPHPHT